MTETEVKAILELLESAESMVSGPGGGDDEEYCSVSIKALNAVGKLIGSGYSEDADAEVVE